MNITKKSTEKGKVLKHVKVYDRLYAMIMDGTYPDGSQLPSEPDLAVQMDVSRMTLRKALSLLREDHLIQNIQGKGNFVKAPASATDFRQVGKEAEIPLHPVRSCCTLDYDQIESEFRIEPPSDYMRNAVKQNTVAVAIVDRWFKNKKDAVSYSLSFIPIEVLSTYNIDLTKPDTLRDFMEETVYDLTADSITDYSYTNTGNFTSEKYVLSQEGSDLMSSRHPLFILIQETLYDKSGKVLLFSKYYIPLQHFNLEVRRSK